MAKVKVRRASRDELPGFAIMRESIDAELAGKLGKPKLLDLEIEVDPVLNHLISHDPEAFLCAEGKTETYGFGAAHIRSRQCIISDLWILPQHRGVGAGEALLSRLIGYGERSGAREFLTLSSVDSSAQSLFLRHQFVPVTPVYHFVLPAERAGVVGAALSRQMPATEFTTDLLNRRGQADVDRIDKLTRNVVRDDDHQFLIKRMGAQIAFVKQNDRVAAYAYGAAGSVGPVAGNSPDAALCALGWGIDFAFAQNPSQGIEMHIPAVFASAIETILDGGGRIKGTSILFALNAKIRPDRWLPLTPSLP